MRISASNPSPLPTESPETRGRERFQVAVTGHVDHGKSTLIGRLLADTGSLPSGKLGAVRSTCERNAKPFEYAFLLDALRDEQAQGITIDTARVFFNTATRTYVIIDTPGHLEFLRNMVSGAARADAALLVIDSHDGVQENSRRHAHMLSMLGIRQIAVVVNKMDLTGYSAETFQRVQSDFGEFLERLQMKPSWFIPASAARGKNLIERSTELAWYDGPTVLEALEHFKAAPLQEGPLRMPVQGVYKFTERGDDRRIIAGAVESGTLRVGDEIVFHPSRVRTRVRRLESFATPGTGTATVGEATGFTTTEPVFVTRGEVVARASDTPPDVGSEITVSLFWLGRRPLVSGRDYVLKAGTARVVARVARVHRVVDGSSLESRAALDQVSRHEVAECTLSLAKPLAFDANDDCAATKRFVLVDDFDIAGGGLVRAVRHRPYGYVGGRLSTTPAVIWLTGLSGAGKSTIAEELVSRLTESGTRVELLDGDVIRSACRGTGFSRAARDAHIRHVGYFASRLEHHGVVVVCALVSPYADSREAVRRMCRRFLEVHVATPLDECERRDVKGLYRRARLGEIAHFTGIDDVYEPPPAPDLRLDTTGLSIEDAAARVLALLQTAGDSEDEAFNVNTIEGRAWTA